MKKRFSYIFKFIVSFVLMPAAAGAVTGASVFFFKLAAEKASSLSSGFFGYIRSSAYGIPLLLLCTLLISAAVAMILHFAPSAKGGGIPTAVAILRGLVTFRWLRTLIGVFVSSMFTYFFGVPLGSEGPSVLIGTSIGMAASVAGGKRRRAGARYAMTGGACAGFGVATGAPVAGVFFALEEAHRRFTPTIIVSAVSGTLAGVFASDILSSLFGVVTDGFGFPVQKAFTLSMIYIPLIAGAAAGLLAIGIFRLFRVLRRFWKKLRVLPRFVSIMLVFLLTAAAACLLPDASGSGHSLFASVFSGSFPWYILLAVLALRAILALSANNVGLTGGLFVPLIIFGLLGGGILSAALASFGLVTAEYSSALIALFTAAFLGASLKTPITAMIFAVEAFGCLENAAFVLLGIGAAYLVTEICGIGSMNDLAVESRLRSENSSRSRVTVDTEMTVLPGAFVTGMSTRDVIWPASCFILSVSHPGGYVRREFSEGDVIHLRFDSCDRDATAQALFDLLGAQTIKTRVITR